ncbi:Ribose ABC transport system, ATP-binding protein RbsA (TC 3.A.1.2.1) [Halanaerobium saccharolyticum subsp. saccharolyticum DSM 6643]|uniref:Ribose ABC transport system, ATP-binding protein RbsA (TC 3.A.1.2.1) n=1 Tax=Halanaerobium saccharolyticum subsp. saccharolyticum DSM 6643 TaxID=1293054 RepID=M5DZS1_9FIRM|nr:sugar ABC transporter ATP-binding protein [Halanaerobium saccharolyticum]CCU78710.1 Ribose ABC transport system, ATP-binding protein RbsA (TC 3.A.1.2.1) [Halanaerobium saccharolyticum subsp. saccharolyticum DSM 6643]
MENKLLKLEKISKSFGGVQALDKVDFDVNKGEIHGLLGENGAGKSTLMKIISGALNQDEGKIKLEDEEVKLKSPLDAENRGIAMVYQELNLLNDLSVTENIFISEFNQKNYGKINWKDLYKRAENEMKKLEVNIDVRKKIKEISVAEQQIVAIIRALVSESKILIMDEPTSALSLKDIEFLLEFLQKLKEKGYSIIFITHKLDEVLEITDRITVLRNGKKIKNLKTDQTDENELSKLIIGRSVENIYPKINQNRGKKLLELNDISLKNKLKNISFSLFEGEILGIVGLLGAGKTEIGKTILGAYKRKEVTGDIYFNEEKIFNKNPHQAIERGIGFVPEDRSSEGLLTKQDVKFNISLSALKEISEKKIIKNNKEKKLVKNLVNKLQIKCSSINQKVTDLSGGNQQKVVLSKWLANQSKIIIFDEPTRGIDVGAKIEVYNFFKELLDMGVGILLLSSEVPEIHGIADRILVLNNGQITNEQNKSEVSKDELQKLVMAGGLK